MGVECQVKITDQNGYNKGDILYIHEGPDYHLGDSRPMFLNIIVTDAVLADIEPYTVEMQHEFDVTMVDDKCRISRRYVSTILTDNTKKRIKAGIRRMLETSDRDLFTEKAEYVEFSVLGRSKFIIEREVNDTIRSPHIPRKYRINPSIIDTALGNDEHTIEITLAELQANIMDKSTRI